MNKLNHVAFIMDGNGRWGQKKKKGRNFGHLRGVQVVREVVKASIELKIPIISFYVFSTENWKRPKSEINYLFRENVSIFFLKKCFLFCSEWTIMVDQSCPLLTGL